MRPIMIVLAGSLSLGLAAEAAAQAAQCFLAGGQPYGPVYRLENPNPGWAEWARRLGGSCRQVSESERHGLEKRPQAYPRDYLAWQARARPGYEPPSYRPPAGYQPPDTGWYGDPHRAAYLVNQWLANQGRPYAQVRDTGRLEYLHEREWRIFFARWGDGSRARIAVRFSQRQGGVYLAMQSYGDGAWAQPQPIGR